MDVNLKRGILDILVLKILSNGESYGYNILKECNSVIDMTESTLYPILRRLESSGFLLSYNMEHNGRLRKYYKITDLGTQKLTQFRDEWKKEFKSILDFIGVN